METLSSAQGSRESKRPSMRDPHKRARAARELRSKVESCITWTAFRKLARRACRVLSGSDTSQRFVATKGFLLNLRSLVAAEAVRCCQRAASFQRLSERKTVDELAIQVADQDDHQRTDPAVHSLCEAVAGETPETRQSATERFYRLGWWPGTLGSENTSTAPVRRPDSEPVEYRLLQYRTKHDARPKAVSIAIDTPPTPAPPVPPAPPAPVHPVIASFAAAVSEKEDDLFGWD